MTDSEKTVDIKSLAIHIGECRAIDDMVALIERLTMERDEARAARRWNLAPLPTDRPVIAIPRYGDGTDASVTWWIEGNCGRWANWPWSRDPIGWIEIPPDPIEDEIRAISKEPDND